MAMESHHGNRGQAKTFQAFCPTTLKATHDISNVKIIVDQRVKIRLSNTTDALLLLKLFEHLPYIRIKKSNKGYSILIRHNTSL
jgi:hypothetical protein